MLTPSPAFARCPRPAPLRLATWASALVVAWALGIAGPAQAQYKVVGPDGKVTYTDRAPADAGARVTTMRSGADNVVPPVQPGLSPEMRKLTAKYPVTLYMANDCAPCASGRQWLLQRGVPFTEKLVVAEDDAAALERLTGARTVPSLTVGTQALRGFSASDWTAYLDAAGYPRDARPAAGWQPPPPTPLVERRAVAAPTPAEAAASVPTAASTPAPVVEAPRTGTRIRF